MSVWDAANDIVDMVKNIKLVSHPHLVNANIWVLMSDSKGIRDNKIIYTKVSKTTKTEKYKTNNDFKIIIIGDSWTSATEVQRKIALDEALCHCGVKRVAMTMEVNGKKEVVKDDIGRTIYTEEIDTDSEGNPRWKTNSFDASLYYAMLQRHSNYSEEVSNVLAAANGRPLLLPNATQQPAVEII